MNPRLQFRVLYRQFRFRLMDLELLSASAHGDANELLGQFGALLVSVSVLLSWFALSVGASMGRQGQAAPIWGVERFMVTLTMLVVGVFAVLNWDAAFLDRRDVLVLGPLPVRGRTLLAAKVAAAASAMSLTVAALNSLSAFLWPMMLAPNSAGLFATLRFVAAFWIALTAAGAFLYCSVLGAQAVSALLPRRWYLRASSVLQLAALMLFLGVALMQPSFATARALAAPENQRALSWLPMYWFMGLLSELSGLFPAEAHAVMAPLARRAVMNLAVAVAIAAAAFLLSYFRNLRKIVEEPDILPSRRGGLWLPRFGSAPQTALAQFTIRTLLRSGRHRVILAFYLGGGFAIVVVYLGGAMHAMHLGAIDLLHKVNAPVLVSTVLLLAAAWLGTRTVFSQPLDLRANWLFRITSPPECARAIAAIRRALLAMSLFPVAALSAAVLLCVWPWTTVLQHLLLLALFGSILADLCLRGFCKIPFTCSYLPGRSKAHMVFWLGIIPAVIGIHKFAVFEESALASPVRYAALAATLGAGAVVARRLCTPGEIKTQYEETPADEILRLGL
jgi:hypothetical protein